MGDGVILLSKDKRKATKKSLDYEQYIFNTYYHKVYQTAYFIVRDEHIAQDITQETFLKAFQNLDSLKEDHKLGAWLGTIATRTAIDYIRKGKNRNDIPTEDVYIDIELTRSVPIPTVEDEVELLLLKDEIREHIAKLQPPEYREVLVLKYIYELRDEEIARYLNESLSAVKSRLHRARKKLRVQLQQIKEIGNGGVS